MVQVKSSVIARTRDDQELAKKQIRAFNIRKVSSEVGKNVTSVTELEDGDLEMENGLFVEKNIAPSQE